MKQKWVSHPMVTVVLVLDLEELALALRELQDGMLWTEEGKGACGSMGGRRGEAALVLQSGGIFERWLGGDF